MPKVIRKHPSKQTKAERLINLKAARAAKKRKSKGITKRKYRRKQKKPRRKKEILHIQRKKPRRMAKRRRTSILTGGSGDVNPQFLSALVWTEDAGGFKNTVINIPFSRLPQSRGAMVFEILKIFIDPPSLPMYTTEILKVTTQFIRIYTGPPETTLYDIKLGTPRVIMSCTEAYSGGSTTTGPGFAHVHTHPYKYDLTDGNGHGVLIATDTINVCVQIVGDIAIAHEFGFKILYRLKNVGLAEYIGIVQSQQ